MHIGASMRAAFGDTSVHRRPAIAPAAMLPKLWTAASSPKAELRSSCSCREGDPRGEDRLSARVTQIADPFVSAAMSGRETAPN